LEERQYFRPLQLPPQYCLASCIDAVQLEDTLGDVQTDCSPLHGGRLLQLVALNGPSLAHRCRQGSSTASDFIHSHVRGYKMQASKSVAPLEAAASGQALPGTAGGAVVKTTVDHTLMRNLAGGAFIVEQRNAVLVGGTGTGKSHLAIAIARACIRSGARGRFYTVVDLVNRLETEARGGRQGRLAEYLTRMDFVVLDELGYLPFSHTGGQLLFHPMSPPHPP